MTGCTRWLLYEITGDDYKNQSYRYSLRGSNLPSDFGKMPSASLSTWTHTLSMIIIRSLMHICSLTIYTINLSLNLFLFILMSTSKISLIFYIIMHTIYRKYSLMSSKNYGNVKNYSQYTPKICSSKMVSSIRKENKRHEVWIFKLFKIL